MEACAAECSPVSEQKTDLEVKIHNISALRVDDTHTDVILVVGTKRYPAHKLILMAVSPVFRKMFSGTWKEKEENIVSLKEPDDCRHVFATFLDLLYGDSDNITLMNESNVVPLLTLADKYGVLDLKDLCYKFMATLVEGDIEKAFEWLSLAEQLDLKLVEDRCYDMICWNLTKAIGYSGWETLTLEQVLTVLERNDVIVDSEYNVIAAALKWLSSVDSTDLEAYAKQILPLIEFKNMTEAELNKVTQMLEKTECLGTIFKKVIFDAFGFRNLESESSFGASLAVKLRRSYLTNLGTVDSALKTTRATNFNSVNLVCGWPEQVKRKLECQLTLTVLKREGAVVYKIVAFDRSTRSSFVRNKSIRVSGYCIIRTSQTGIVHHVLNFDQIIEDVTGIANGGSIVEFQQIPCLDIGQFDGHYLGKFDFIYRMIIKQQ